MSYKRFALLFLVVSLFLTACGKTEELSMDDGTNTQERIEIAAKMIYKRKFIGVEYKESLDQYQVFSKTSRKGPDRDVDLANSETLDFLEKIQNEDFDSLYIEEEADFSDEDGNKFSSKGIAYHFSKEKVEKIDFKNFEPEKLPEIADNYWLNEVYK